MTADGLGERLQPLLDRMAGAATDWLASLRPAQRAKASYPFPATEERTRWYYTPNEQGGLPLAEMGPVQQRLAHRLTASGLSEGGYATASTIMGLENALDAVEGWRRRYPGRAGPSRGRDPLLLGSLAPDQRPQAVLSPAAPGDVVQANRPVVEVGPPAGLAAARMLPRQRELLLALLHQYLGRLPDPLAAVETERVSGDGLEAVHFGWAGGAEPGQPHYYRVQGPRLLIEYVNVQNGANHVHSVWRDPLGDFGQSSAG